MPPTQYKVWHWGGPVGEGAMQSQFVGLHAVAKGNSVGYPFTVANEWICGQLARAACLPVPPAAIVDKSGEPFHASLDFNLAGHQLPPADPQALANEHPELACGIVLFDAWIVNDDRHKKNLAFDQTTKAVQLFDHSHALLRPPDPMARLQQNATSLAIGGHCLAPVLTNLDGMGEWHSRFNAIPSFYIEDAIRSAVSWGLPASIADSCLNFLLDRRTKLLGIVANNKAMFTGMQPQLLDAWAQTTKAGP